MLIELRIPFIEVTTRQLGLLDAHKKLGVMNGRMIIVNGGGNLGTLWFDVEMQFRHLIKENPKSKIFVFQIRYITNAPDGVMRS